MPVTFGSVGDIIAVCLLVKDLVEALDQARGSKAEYQSAIRELWILDRTLLEIELFTKAHENASTPELRGLCETAKDAALQCKTLVSTFRERVKKYKSTFDDGEDPGLLKDVAAKVRWRIGEKDALEQFRTEIVRTSSSLQMLLAAASVTLIDIHRKATERQLAAHDQQNARANTQQSGALEYIRQRIEDTQQQIDTGNIVLNQISNTLRLDWLRQLGSELKGLIGKAIAMNVATYHAVISIQAALSNRLERTLIDEPFILEDPIGRIAPVHLQFVTSWEAFHAVMENRFSNLQGFRKIQQRKYGLQDGATGREIALTRPWQRAFLPGQRVEMAFIFQSDGAKDASATNTTCPGCQSPSQNTGDTDIHCHNCFIWYRRITEEQEVEHAASVSGPIPPDRKRVAPDDLEGEEDIRDFKRVRVMRTKRMASPNNSDEKINLRGGLSINGRPTELVLEKDGKIIPLTKNAQPARPTKAFILSRCNNCRKANLSCDGQCPCGRCVASGKYDTCTGMIYMKRPGLDTLPKSKENSNMNGD
ncbi:hypothetical protein B5807_09803 [Epicoccum nigrum]|uniref:Ubiquitin-like domain-containing protein n=1 Tax=Epicoccum nigrum TaxID=105696 RepID=A0A1Y2LTU0_EPING|nr:hypothetical protein B5807_09803 [Epicoccum nigrum]